MLGTDNVSKQIDRFLVQAKPRNPTGLDRCQTFRACFKARRQPVTMRPGIIPANGILHLLKVRILTLDQCASSDCHCLRQTKDQPQRAVQGCRFVSVRDYSACSAWIGKSRPGTTQDADF